MSDPSSIQDHALENVSDDEGMLIEDRLWWVLGRKAIIRAHLQRAHRALPIATTMDVGCGSGGNLDVLREFGRVIGMEPSSTLARRARRRGIADTVYEKDTPELREYQNVELFTMFDVLEHIEDDRDFLLQLRRKAPQSHQLLVSVPACPFLFSDHDRILHHHRRYTEETLRLALEHAGYKVAQVSYFMFCLFPLVLLARTMSKFTATLGRKSEGVEVGDFPSFISIPFAATLRLEAALSQWAPFPIGLWLFALAESGDLARPTTGASASRRPSTLDKTGPAPLVVSFS